MNSESFTELPCRKNSLRTDRHPRPYVYPVGPRMASLGLAEAADVENSVSPNQQLRNPRNLVVGPSTARTDSRDTAQNSLREPRGGDALNEE